MNFAISILEQGLIYGILSLGIYITYKILDFPDLTVDGSFPLGAAVTAYFITNGGNPYLALVLSFIAGVAAGCITGVIHVKFQIRDLLSGIIMMTALWTLNLRIAGTSNVPLFSQETIFKNEWFHGTKPYSSLLVIGILAIFSKMILDLFLETEAGYLLRAVGDNEVLVTSLAKDSGNVKILGLALANGFVSFAGSIFCQSERVFEISSGTGAMVIGLASVIIGTAIFKNLTPIKTTTTVLMGSIIYKACVAIALKNFEPQDMKMITAVLFLGILVVSSEKKKKVKNRVRA